MADEKNNNQENNEPIIENDEMKMPEGNFGVAEEKTSSTLGLILAVLIVVLVLILGGLYLWGTTLNDSKLPEPTPAERPTAEENNEPESTNAEAEVQVLETVSTSDEIEAIEADIESTNLDELDAELNAIEAELDASLE